MENKKSSYCMILGAVLIWSLSGVLIKSITIDSLWMSFIRTISAGIFLSPYIFKERILPIKNLILGSLFMAIFILALTITTKISSAAMAISMQYTAPIYVIAYSFYINKKIRIDKAMVFSLIFLGIAFNGYTTLKNSNMLSIVTGVITGLSFICYSYNLKKISSGNLLGVISIINLGAAFCFGLLLLYAKPIPPESFYDVGIIGASGIVISGISYVLYAKGLHKISMERALIICLAEPILNPFWVYLGTREIPHFFTIGGLFLILSGAFLDIVAERFINK